MGTLDGAVSLVTGAASGIGRAATLACACAGASVVAVDRDADGLQAVAAELHHRGARALTVTVDLGDLEAVPEVVERAVRGMGRVDHLVNAAGVTGGGGTLLEPDLASWRQVYAVNLEAPLMLMHAFAHHVNERGGGGRIVNVSSSSAFRARRSALAYGSSKAALVQLTRSVAAELGPLGVNVNAVAPGLTRSAMTASIGEGALVALVSGDGPLGNLLQRVADPEDVAAVILFLCEPASRQVTGQTIHTSAGAVV